MTDDIADSGSSRVLDPIDRISEVLFGLFMVLTFTGTLSVVDSGRDEVRSMLIAAIGCNIAWGFVDGVMYVLRNLVARGRKARLVRAVRAATPPEQARRLIGGEIGALAGALGATSSNACGSGWSRSPARPHGVRVTGLDLRGALAVFLLVFGVDLSGRAAVRLHRRPGRGQARLGRGGDRDAVPLRLFLGPLRRPEAVAHRPGDGAAGAGRRGGRHRAGRLTIIYRSRNHAQPPASSCSSLALKNSSAVLVFVS